MHAERFKCRKDEGRVLTSISTPTSSKLFWETSKAVSLEFFIPSENSGRPVWNKDLVNIQWLRLRDVMGPMDKMAVRDGRARSPKGFKDRERWERRGSLRPESSFSDWMDNKFSERSRDDRLDKVGSKVPRRVMVVSDSLHLDRRSSLNPMFDLKQWKIGAAF